MWFVTAEDVTIGILAQGVEGLTPTSDQGNF